MSRKHGQQWQRELIDTLWNVNSITAITCPDSAKELIDTLWNVNVSSDGNVTIDGQELIDTLWNVNPYGPDISCIVTELIDTLWNVNLFSNLRFSYFH